MNDSSEILLSVSELKNLLEGKTIQKMATTNLRLLIRKK